MDRTKRLEDLIRLLVCKSIQTIVSSREDYLIETESGQPMKDRIALNINESVEIKDKIKEEVSFKSFMSGVPCFVVVSLETCSSPARNLMLEVWTMKLSAPTSLSSGLEFHQCVEYATTFLKSLVSLSRMLPAREQTKKSGPESYLMMYSIYMGDPDFSGLGEGYGKLQIGNTPTPLGVFSMHNAHRTVMVLSPMASIDEPFDVDIDEEYFGDKKYYEERRYCKCQHDHDETVASNLYGSILAQSPNFPMFASPPKEHPVARRASSDTILPYQPPFPAKRAMSETVIRGLPPHGRSLVSESDSDSDSFGECDEDDSWLVQEAIAAHKRSLQAMQPEPELEPEQQHTSPLVIKKEIKKLNGKSPNKSPSSLHSKSPEEGEEDDFELVDSASSSFEGLDSTSAMSFYHSLQHVPGLKEYKESSEKKLIHSFGDTVDTLEVLDAIKSQDGSMTSSSRSMKDRLEKYTAHFNDVSAWMEELNLAGNPA